MQRINTPDGNFHAGNPATGELGTIVTKEFMQAVQDEIATAVEGAGFELDPNDNGQLLDAIKTLTQQSVSSVGMDSGAANAYVVKFTPPIENPAPWAPLWFKVANANTGPSTLDTTGSEYALVGGAHQPLQGGELVAAGNALVYWNPSLDNGHGQYVLLFCSGAAQQIAPGTQPGHALQLGQFLSQAQPLVASIAALRALPKAKYSNVTVASYNGDSVSRSLQFWQDTNDNASDENGVTVIIAADGARWKLRSSGPISPCDAGAKGNGVDDDSVALV
ncbi:hypothetical protein [Burkholderia anthina]|uniref:hypothetical protein n=1 Tax=Burkholderia anthina TaxID=179879 RepID=UPI00158BB435